MEVQQLFANLRKEAECPLCLEIVSNPKTLQCLHSFCLVCLDKLANYTRRQLQSTIKCPVCQTSFQIPEGDTFINFPSSFHLNRLVDLLALKDGGVQAQKCNSCDENNTATCFCFVCQSIMCSPCLEAHQRLKTTRGHRNVSIDKLQAKDVEDLIQRPGMCSQQYHEREPLEFYCEECKIPICQKCCAVSHNRHTITDSQKAAQVRKMQMTDAMEKVKAEVVICEMQMKKQVELMDKSKQEVLFAEKKMIDAVEELIRDLRKHQRTMKAKFCSLYDTEHDVFEGQLENYKLLVTQMKGCLDQGKSIVERNISAEIFQTNQSIIGRCEDLLNARKPEIYTSPHFHYFVERKPGILDRVVVSYTDPKMCEAKAPRQTEEIEKTQTKFTIVTKDSDGMQCYQLDDQISVEIVTPSGDQLEATIKDTNDGNYKVTYTPECTGQHRVEIQVNGQTLTGSPWYVQVFPHQYKFAFQFGSTGKGQREKIKPWDIAVNEKTGRIAIADLDNKRIQIFTCYGNLIRQIRVKNSPTSLSFTASGDILVCVPKDNKKLSLFNEDGQFITHISGVETLKKPHYLCIGKDDGIIVCDKADNKIKVLSPDGKDLLQSFRSADNDAYPRCALHHQGKFFVSYPDSQCIKVFNDAGVYVHDIGCAGSEKGQLICPTGIAIDKANNIIVCDTGNKRLQLFTLDGHFVAKIEGEFFKESFLWSVAVSNHGHLFVTDLEKNCVYVFR